MWANCWAKAGPHLPSHTDAKWLVCWVHKGEITSSWYLTMRYSQHWLIAGHARDNTPMPEEEVATAPTALKQRTYPEGLRCLLEL